QPVRRPARGRRGPGAGQHGETGAGKSAAASTSGVGDAGATCVEVGQRRGGAGSGSPLRRRACLGNGRVVVIPRHPLARLLPPWGRDGLDTEGRERLTTILGVPIDSLDAIRLGPRYHYRPIT